MNTYEELQDEACKDGIEIIDNYAFKSERISGLYCDSTIALSKNLKRTAEKKCVLAEELGHHYTAAGDIIDQSSVENRKQEMRGRIWAYNNQVGLRGIIDAYLHNCKNLFEMADYFGVTEKFLNDSLTYYTNKYGICTQLDNYIIYFDPLGILKLCE